MTGTSIEREDRLGWLMRAVNRMSRSGLDPRVTSSVVDAGLDASNFSASWEKEGRRWAELAAGAASEGKLVSARLWYRQAFYCFRLAEFAYHENSTEKLHSYDSSLACFESAVGHGKGAPRPIHVPVDGQELRGYLVLPEGTERVPMVLHIYGADGNKEEHYWSTALPMVERGLGVLVVDGPGQGWAVRHDGIGARPDFEAVASACVDFVETVERADLDRLGLMGSSMGGYYGPRAFLSDGRFRVCLVNSALYDVVGGLWDTYPAIRPQLTYNVLARTFDEAREIYTSFTLTGVGNADPNRPACVFHGSGDRLIPVSEARRTAEALGPNTELIIWEGAGHNLGDVAIEARPKMYDWLASRLAG